ncbi:MAG: glycoside hydrolase family 3 C-terminal domain-containing protein [Prevotellaceae bacterium]|jgi:beta-glucosidase|nr:glycoside hydrolase family 3 C-terminal domain-containing protein [Prevotellaceae bacterium]
MKPTTTLSLLCSALLFAACQPEPQPDYLNTKLSFEQRADDLVARMTLEQKALQLCYDAPGIDSLHLPAHNWWNECLHGVARTGIATVFPQAIGMGAMWDDEEMFRIATAISDEARAKHHAYAAQGKRNIYQGLSFWTPNINIFRDPRWGRGMETYGEDPYLTGELAVDFIKGLQGDDPRYYKVIATAKHFAVHSGPEPVRHAFDVYPSGYDLLDTYAPHFEKTVREGGVYSVMCAYQRLMGVPCCGSAFLENLLRNDWGFEGYIVSDCWAVNDFFNPKAHHIVETKAEAAAMAVKAGTDLNCGNSYPALVEAVEKGLITEAEIDVSVKRMMVARMKLGQLDPDKMVKYAKIPYSVVDSKEHQALALEAARKSMVLLKNEGSLLPLSKEVKKVAVIGPNANDTEVLLGNYNGFPSNPKTPLKGIREKLPHAEVRYAQGCPLAAQLPSLQPVPAEALFTDAEKKTPGLHAEYFDNDRFEGAPKHVRVDPNVCFEWFTTPPFEDLPYDSFSVRWTGVLVPPVSGSYAIGGEAFRGFKLYLEEELLLQQRSDHHPSKVYEVRTLEAGKPYRIRMEYSQKDTEYALARLLWEKPQPDLRQEAVALAKQSDVVILCMGLSPLLEGEEMKVKVEGFLGGDRLDIKLPAVQTELMREIYALGKPTVLVLLNGSALAFGWEAEHIPAILEAWYPGQAGGAAIADVLFGDYNPAGRLPLTFYASVAQLPPFDSYDMTGRTYRYFDGKPLYEFGYGLSYTKFEYKNLNAPKTVKVGENIALSVEVTNTGKHDGDEVVQLYVAHEDAKRRVPIRALQGFKRIHIKAGETKTADFILTPQQLAQIDVNRWVTEPGKVRLSVGGKQPDREAIDARRVAEASVSLEAPGIRQAE